MNAGDIIGSIFMLAVVGFFVLVAFTLRNYRRDLRRDEALFVSMFPDLQPWFHPRKLLSFVHERLRSPPPKSGKAWKRPPGFDVEAAETRFADGREQMRLLDAEGKTLAVFSFEDHKEGGVIRFGKGKFTVSTRDGNPRVRYWHPDREFKWSARKGWTFVTRVADEPFSRSDSDSASSSSSSSISGTTAAAAGAAGIVAAGGSFDGGGASQGWDEQGGTATTY